MDGGTVQIYHIRVSDTKYPHIRVQVNETEFEALLDSGAGTTEVQPAAVRVGTADRTEYRCLGYLNIPFTYKGMTKVVHTIIVPQISRPLSKLIFWRASESDP